MVSHRLKVLYKDGSLQVIVAELRSNVRVDLGIKKGSKKPKHLQKSRMKYDEDMVSKCCDLLKQWPPISHAFYRYNLVLMLQLR